MSELGWLEAIKKVLSDADEPMHYKAIAEEIAARGLRESLGATPANTVNSYINASMRSDGGNSPFLKSGRGYYGLRESKFSAASDAEKVSFEEEQPSGLIQSLGMYWRSSEVIWKNHPNIYGRQQIGSDVVDFCDQVGVYLLHDRSRVVYVGRSVDRPMGQRLFEHTRDRLNGRWDRFSWFGLKSVSDSGELTDVVLKANDVDVVISSFEAILIEALEPPQNRRRGDQLAAVEYLQASDPKKDKAKVEAITALISGTLIQDS